jgi:adenosylcobinamide kinase / adenosylcobinamide-phosphate guanylyltransferase
VLVLLLGGARSGKSALAVAMAAATGEEVAFVATGEAGDDEMAARIAAHRGERPSSWATVEEPVDLAGALARLPLQTTVVVDCLTLWVANMMGMGRDDGDVTDAAAVMAAAAAARPGRVIVVSNEVGWGIVPFDPSTRRYRDVLGRVNAIFAGHAQEAQLVVAGRVLALHPSPVTTRGPR